ncbi:hypothetical protein PIB30_040778 [Stylosanthes scabra]|uniref:Uncharacterized protein n=1 Tax=Stylosanthes scabra TaxID=79078 RepID=A0ABU6QE39_9FABA|nr:hypothetical protein [Stylosanthes scabra]
MINPSSLFRPQFPCYPSSLKSKETLIISTSPRLNLCCRVTATSTAVDRLHCGSSPRPPLVFVAGSPPPFIVMSIWLLLLVALHHHLQPSISLSTMSPLPSTIYLKFLFDIISVASAFHNPSSCPSPVGRSSNCFAMLKDTPHSGTHSFHTTTNIVSALTVSVPAPSPADHRPLTVAVSDLSLLKPDCYLLVAVLCSNRSADRRSAQMCQIYSSARRLASLAVSPLRSSLPLVVTAYHLCPIAAFPLVFERYRSSEPNKLLQYSSVLLTRATWLHRYGGHLPKSGQSFTRGVVGGAGRATRKDTPTFNVNRVLEASD